MKYILFNIIQNNFFIIYHVYMTTLVTLFYYFIKSAFTELLSFRGNVYLQRNLFVIRRNNPLEGKNVKGSTSFI